MTLISERIALLRAGLAKHPEHIALLAETLHLEQAAETLAQHAAALDAAEKNEGQTDASSANTGKEVFDTWKLLQKQVRQLTNLLEWHIESTHAGLLPAFASVPSSRLADVRAQHLLDFAVQHTELTDSQLVEQEVAALRSTLAAYQAARAHLPEAKSAENAADDLLRVAKTTADTYADCLEMLLRRLLRDTPEALRDYGLERKVVAKTTPEAAPAA